MIDKIDLYGRIAVFKRFQYDDFSLETISIRTTEDFDLFKNCHTKYVLPLCVMNVQDQYNVDCRIYSTKEKLKYIYDNLNSIFSCIFKNISLEDTYVSFTSLEHVFKDSWYCLVLDNTTHPIDECKINREDL